MIADIQRQINEGTISHSTINQDHRSPSRWKINGGFYFHIFPFWKLGLFLNIEHVRGPQSSRTIDLEVIDKSTFYVLVLGKLEYEVVRTSEV